VVKGGLGRCAPWLFSLALDWRYDIVIAECDEDTKIPEKRRREIK